jgi:hypothetical protein
MTTFDFTETIAEINSRSDGLAFSPELFKQLTKTGRNPLTQEKSVSGTKPQIDFDRDIIGQAMSLLVPKDSLAAFANFYLQNLLSQRIDKLQQDYCSCCNIDHKVASGENYNPLVVQINRVFRDVSIQYLHGLRNAVNDTANLTPEQKSATIKTLSLLVKGAHFTAPIEQLLNPLINLSDGAEQLSVKNFADPIPAIQTFREDYEDTGIIKTCPFVGSIKKQAAVKIKQADGTMLGLVQAISIKVLQHLGIKPEDKPSKFYKLHDNLLENKSKIHALLESPTCKVDDVLRVSKQIGAMVVAAETDVTNQKALAAAKSFDEPLTKRVLFIIARTLRDLPVNHEHLNALCGISIEPPEELRASYRIAVETIASTLLTPSAVTLLTRLNTPAR